VVKSYVLDGWPNVLLLVKDKLYSKTLIFSFVSVNCTLLNLKKYSFYHFACVFFQILKLIQVKLTIPLILVLFSTFFTVQNSFKNIKFWYYYMGSKFF